MAGASGHGHLPLEDSRIDFAYSPKVQALQSRLTEFMEAHIYPNEARYEAKVSANRAASSP